MNSPGSDRSLELTRREFVVGAAGLAALAGALSAEAQPMAADPLQAPWRPRGPRRLSDETHELARRALSGEHGRSMTWADFGLDETQAGALSPDLRYAAACSRVAEQAPLRILPGERVVGSATLLEGPAHQTPVFGGSSTSHTTLGFDKVLQVGYRGLREQIAQRLARGDLPVEHPPLAQGRFGDGLPGPGRYATVAGSERLSQPPLTVECWAQLHAKAGYNLLVAHADKRSRRHWELYTEHTTGNLAAYVPGYAPAIIIADCPVVDGAWHHLAMRFSTQRLRLFCDGVCVADTALQPSGDAALEEIAGPVWLGAYLPAGLGCAGVLDAVHLRAGEHEPSPPDAPPLVTADTLGLWQFEENENGRFADAAGRAGPAVDSASRNGADLLQAMIQCLDAERVWRERHVAELTHLANQLPGEQGGRAVALRDMLSRVPETPPETFHEAVQALWFAYAYQRLMGNWSGLGRIDQMLGPFLERDLADGRIDLDEAREILAHFWIHGCEWIGAFDHRGSGDAQHYQNIILAGVDADGREVANEVTYLVLDIVEELHISDFPIAVRLNAHSPERLLRRVAEVQRHGGGIVACYNEDKVIEGLVAFGYDLAEARTFTNDGCWEVLIPGRTTFAYLPFDGLGLLHEVLGLHDEAAPAPAFATFEALYAAYLERLERHVAWHHAAADGWARHGPPTPLVSLLVEDCIDRARGYLDRGARYTVLAPHLGGLANIANSLLAIREQVYEQGRLSLPELVEVLRRDWRESEPLRQLVRTRMATYGNDADAADDLARRVHGDYARLVGRVKARNGVLRPAGLSTFGREIEWSAPDGPRRASPDGHRRGAVLATNTSPSPGTDRLGPTAALKSYTKLDLAQTPNGATLELKLHPDSVRGDTGLAGLISLLRSFVALGGWYLHVDVVDSAMLREAQQHPDQYPNLAVRIAGWSARFATLNEA